MHTRERVRESERERERERVTTVGGDNWGNGAKHRHTILPSEAERGRAGVL